MKKNIFFTVLFLLTTFHIPSTAKEISSRQSPYNLSNANFESTLSSVSNDNSHNDEMWYWLNLARLQQFSGDYNSSIQSFEKAYAILDDYENRATISIRNIGSFFGSLFMSKGTESYYGKGYERTLMHSMNALNYVMLHDFEGASVELRRMQQRQEFWLKENEEKIKDAADDKAKANRYGSNVNSIPSGYSMAAMLQDEDVRSLANSYQDPFSYTLSNIINTIIGLPTTLGEADVNLKRALALNPNVANAFFTSNNKNYLPNLEVTVIMVAGQAPGLKIDRVRFPIFHGAEYTSIDLPAYSQPQNDIHSFSLITPGLTMQPPRLLKSNIMAYKTLKDELPVDLSKAVARAVTKAVAAKQISDKYGPLAGMAASLTFDIGSTYKDSDYRNWELLPNSGYIANFKAKKGETLTMILNNRQENFTLPSEGKGVILFVSYLTSDNVRIDHVNY